MAGGVLGILVNSDRHFDQVLKLAEAATATGRQVRIHVLQKGFGLFSTGYFDRLSRLTRISACAAGLDGGGPQRPGSLPGTVDIVSEQQFAEVMRELDRAVVF